MDRNRWRKAAVAGLIVGTALVASLATGTLTSAQEVTTTTSADGATTTTAEGATSTTTAEDTPVSPTPASFGDVHFRTPDALVFDIQDVGDFILLQDTTGDVVIQSRQETLDVRPGISINTAAAINVAGDTLEFYLSPQPLLLVNGVETDFPDGALDLPQGGVLTGSITQTTVGVEETTPNDVQIDWPDGNTAARVLLKRDSHLDIGVVRLAGELTFEGVLGNLDGDANNDMQLRDGDLVEQPTDDEGVRGFADSWRTPAAESLFGNGETPVPDPEVADDLLAPEDLDADVVEEAQETCEASGIDDPLAIETCVYDVAATGDEVYVESATTFQEAVEELPESAPGNVFATEEPDLVPDDDSSFPWILVVAGGAVVLVLVVLLVVRAKSKK